MNGKNNQNIAIIFGKEDNNSFNRYTFSILGRPASLYPILAAVHSQRLDDIYLSSDSPDLLNLGSNINRVNVIKREKSQPTLTEEVRHALEFIIKTTGSTPNTVTLLLANSPCSTSGLIDEAINFLEEHTEYDSVVTTMKRAEFSPARIFSINNQNQLEPNKINYASDEVYFLDRRVIVVKADVILNSRISNNYFESLLGEKVHPIIQEDGIWDIDYFWQIPIVERWLRQNGFNDIETPYDKLKQKSIPDYSYLKTSKYQKDNNKDRLNILITTVPFGEKDPKPINLLNNASNIKYVINPIGRKLKEAELIELVKDYDILIAGTEPITRKVMESGKKLKLISRVGIGLDSVDLKAAKELGIKVSYTPDAPAPAVAELTLAHMINLLRRVPLVDRKLRSGIWQRIHGERLANLTIGIIGTGRVGSRVLRHLQGFSPKKILVNDLKPDFDLYKMYNAEFVEKEIIYSESDIISLHIPMNKNNYNLINRNRMELMKKHPFLINTSRGGIINEEDLYNALNTHQINGAAIDVFETEPYTGKLVEMDNCYLSCHMGSMTSDCRANMEIQATEEACRFAKGEELKLLVPEEEYEIV